MPLINHEGGSETSYDKEKYKERIEEYLRARSYSIERRLNHHSTTENLAAVGVDEDLHCLNGEKVGDEFKKFIRVEAKAGDLSRLNQNFLTELADLRVRVDRYRRGPDQALAPADALPEERFVSTGQELEERAELGVQRLGHVDRCIAHQSAEIGVGEGLLAESAMISCWRIAAIAPNRPDERSQHNGFAGAD